jgi:hypothetical protein
MEGIFLKISFRFFSTCSQKNSSYPSEAKENYRVLHLERDPNYSSIYKLW